MIHRIALILLLVISQSINARSSYMLVDTVPLTQETGMLKTSWNDFHTASASQNIPIINPPSPSPTGDTNVDFPLTLPDARNDLKPAVGFSYSAEGGSSWLGTGWNFSLPSFSLDTRWGVPVFDQNVESEIYLYNGEQIGPVFFRSKQYDRKPERTFHQRQEGTFHKIIRHGSTPKNYWWEVREKNGTVHYFGGNPLTGASNEYRLKTSDGNIIEWLICETRDIYTNLITYNYQFPTYKGGKAAFPKTITYNGFGDTPGNYKIEFNLKSNGRTRKDISMSMRTGMRYTVADLLGNVEISYKDEIIRTYRLIYGEGVFFKTLLKEIAEYDKDGRLFYKYGFDYHKDVNVVADNGKLKLDLFEESRDWSVAKDNLDLQKVISQSVLDNVDNVFGEGKFIEFPTMLGGAQSTNNSTGLAITVGLIGNLASKENTVGANGGVGWSNSYGVSSLVDINGDGLPDKLWKEKTGLYYRENLNPLITGQYGFSPIKKKINGISDFSLSNSFSYNAGGELNLGAIATGAFVGYSYENSTSNITTYMADFNGDELLDIAHNKEVYFNTIDAQGIPSFVLSSGETESPIYVGEPIDDSLSETDPEEEDRIENANPLHDAVRLWKAPFSGVISVTGEVQLIEDNNPETKDLPNKDGVIVMIQHDNRELWRSRINPDDYAPKTPLNVSSILVSKGDSLYFRVHSIYNGYSDQVLWDPIITYANNDIDDENIDGQSFYQYQASKDFIVGAYYDNIITTSGTVKIAGRIKKPITSDTVFISIKGGIMADTFFRPSQVVDFDLSFENLVVNSNDEYNISIYSKSNIKWSDIEWAPELSYTAYEDGSDAVDSLGNSYIRECPIIDFKTFSYTHEIESPFIVPTTGNAKIKLELTGPLLEYMGQLTIKIKNKPDSIYRSDPIITQGTTYVIEGYFEKGDTLFASYNNILDPPNFIITPFFIRSCIYDVNGEIYDIQCGLYSSANKKDRTRGNTYRGWSQFVYNANNGRGRQKIITTSLKIDEDEVAGDTTLIEEDTDPEGVEGSNVDLDELFLVVRADHKVKAWLGPDPLTFINQRRMTASRNGEQDLLGSSNSAGGDKFTTVNLKTKSDSHAIAGGVGIVGGGLTLGTSWCLVDISDMNGDRFPDILYENSIQYTNPRGGLSYRTFKHNFKTHVAKSEARGGGVGGSFINTGAKNSTSAPGKGTNKSTARTKSKQKSKMSGSKNAYKTSKASASLSGNISGDSDYTNHTFADINGDGLEDKLWIDGQVAINTGYGFGPKESWDFNTIRSGSAVDGALGLGFNYMNGSVAFGASVSKTVSASHTGFTDFNNDALIDLIVEVDPLTVRFNTGHGFSEEIVLTDEIDLDESISVGESVNGASTVCFPLFFIKVCINPSYSRGQGSSNVRTTFNDIDGDGYTDYLTAIQDDGNLTVHASKAQKTNLLKSINYPTGGNLTIDYAIAGNNSNTPFSKWVMKEVIIDDGVDGDGLDINYRRYHYEDSRYDRHERQFMGFGTIDEFHIDEDDITHRHLKTKYHVDDFYKKGLKRAEYVLDGQGLEYQRTEYYYTLVDVKKGRPLPQSFISKDDGMAYPSLTEKTIYISETSPNEYISRRYTYEYDKWGNELTIRDEDLAGKTLVTQRTYDYDTTRYILTHSDSEIIKSDNVVYRSTQYTRNDNGDITQIKSKIDDSNWSIHDFTYDIYGNQLTRSNPENYEGDRLTFEYNYDEEEHQYLVSEKDGYGYEKTYAYEPIFNSMTAYTDINGNTTLYEVDEKGRASKITYPKEVRNGIPYSISFDYYPLNKKAYAQINHYDEATGKDLIVYEFEDGIFRNIQTKITSTLRNDKRDREMTIVSGTQAFDALGRYDELYLAISEQKGSESTLNKGASTIQPTRIAYDVYDRIVKTTDAYNVTTTYDYDLSIAQDGKSYISTHITYPLGNTETQYFNARGDIVAIRKDSPDGDLWTTYEYDGFGQVIRITDPLGNKTVYSYDLLGRKIEVKVPDAGTTELQYDAAGNLIKRITATIRDVVSRDGAIRYHYDKERLVQIDYPKYFQNKVQIHYGSPQDSFNRAGRIWLQEDATGGREYFFDENGNPTKTIRTVMINRSEIYTFVTEASYDSWGRVMSYTHADGENVDYAYHHGGQLLSISGNKGGQIETYLAAAGYNQHQDIVVLDYGNKSKETFVYDNKRRLSEKALFTSNMQMVKNDKFTYDLSDNLISRTSTNTDQLGGNQKETFEYDNLYRLINAGGVWTGEQSSEEYNMFFDYNELNQLSLKSQEHFVDGNKQILTSRIFDYKYASTDQPTRPSQVGGKDYTYDKNGNILLVNSRAIFDFDQNIYDEENRLIGTSNNGYISRYTYDAFGRRTIKSHGEQLGVFINGAPAGFLEHRVNYNVVVNPYFDFKKNQYRKHYYLGDTRLLTKIGTGRFVTNLGDAPEITAGGINYKKRIADYERSILDYYAGLDVPPGPPTLLALLGQPEINSTSLPDATGDSYENKPPLNWPNIAPPDTTGPPGPPVFYEFADVDNTNVTAGYNFTDGSLVKEVEQFYYHYDQNGSTNYVTDYAGYPRQYATYFPSGERWIHNTSAKDETNFMWNALRLDAESGYYNMGNIYYDPKTNIEQSIDPVLQNFGEQTFLSRLEGELYYDYSEGGKRNDDPKFDIQILNSEKPSPFFGPSSNSIDGKSRNSSKTLELTYKDIKKALGGEVPWNVDASSIQEKTWNYKVIKEIAPHLNSVDLSDQANINKLVNDIVINPRINKLKRKLKKLIGMKDKSKKPALKPKRKNSYKVRFK